MYVFFLNQRSLFGIPIFYLISIIQQNREYVLDFYTKFGVVLSVLLRCVFLLRMILRLCILSSYLQKIILKSFFFFLVYDSLIFNSNEFVGHYKSVSVSISSFRLFQFHLRTFFLSLIFIITTFPIHCLSYHSFLFQIIVHKTLPIFILQQSRPSKQNNLFFSTSITLTSSLKFSNLVNVHKITLESYLLHNLINIQDNSV